MSEVQDILGSLDLLLEQAEKRGLGKIRTYTLNAANQKLNLRQLNAFHVQVVLNARTKQALRGMIRTLTDERVASITINDGQAIPFPGFGTAQVVSQSVEVSTATEALAIVATIEGPIYNLVIETANLTWSSLVDIKVLVSDVTKIQYATFDTAMQRDALNNWQVKLLADIILEVQGTELNTGLAATELAAIKTNTGNTATSTATTAGHAGTLVTSNAAIKTNTDKFEFTSGQLKVSDSAVATNTGNTATGTAITAGNSSLLNYLVDINSHTSASATYLSRFTFDASYCLKITDCVGA